MEKLGTLVLVPTTAPSSEKNTFEWLLFASWAFDENKKLTLALLLQFLSLNAYLVPTTGQRSLPNCYCSVEAS